jgi:DNA repair protein RecO (recombination protein O)
MSAEKALALVLRTTDWSETSRIATLWTREFGKVRVLAKGGRRLKSNFENALDLLTLCRVVFLRKSSGGLDILTEARVEERFLRLRSELSALYSAYYIAELLSDWTEDYDPHPFLFDEAVDALKGLGAVHEKSAANPGGTGNLGHQVVPTGHRLLRFELVLLRELGYTPALSTCAVCGRELQSNMTLAFSPATGGILCPDCRSSQRDAISLSHEAWRALQDLSASDDAWRRPMSLEVRSQLRNVLNHYVTYLMGRRPRLLPYLGS